MTSPSTDWNIPQEWLDNTVAFSLEGPLITMRTPDGREAPPTFPTIGGRLIAIRGGTYIVRSEGGEETTIPKHRIMYATKYSDIAVVTPKVTLR